MINNKLKKYFIKNTKFHKIFFYSIYTQATGTHIPQVFFLGGILTIYILNIGGSNFDIGLSNMVFHSSIIISYSIFPLIQNYRINTLMNNFSILSLVFFTFFYLIINFSSSLNLNTILLIIFISTILFRTSDNIYGISRITYVYDNIPKHLHGRYFGSMRLIISMIVISISLLSGYVLSDNPTKSNFNNLILIYILIFLFRIYFSFKLPIINKFNLNKKFLLSNYLIPLKNQQFRNFLFHDIFIISIYTIVNPFFIPFLIEDLNFPSSLAIYSFSCLQIGNIISLLKWGKIVDRLGNAKTTKYSMYIIFLSYTLIYFLPNFNEYNYFSFISSIVAFLILGIGLSGLNISYTVRFLDKIKKDSRLNFLNVGILISHSIRAIWPLLVGIVLSLNFIIFDINININFTLIILFILVHLLICLIYFKRIFKH